MYVLNIFADKVFAFSPAFASYCAMFHVSDDPVLALMGPR
jgi:hypothetical protein